MKRSTPWWSLLDRQTPWLSWWQELILNWVATWHAIGELTVTAADSPDEWVTWDVPSDLELIRAELEELIQ